MQLHEMMQHALSRPGAVPAVRYRDEWYSWGWLRTLADGIDAALTSGGVPPGSRVGVVARNTPACIAALLSLIARQRSIVMIYAFQSPAAVAGDVRELNVDALVVEEPDCPEEVSAAARDAGIVTLATRGTRNSVRCITMRSSPAPLAADAASAAAIAMLTSGTTGKPKRVALSFAMIARAMVGESSEKTTALPDASGLGPALMMFPFGNISGLYSYFPMAASGQPVVLLDKFTVPEWLDFVRQYRPQRANLPPAGVRMLLDAEVPGADLQSIRYIASGAAWLDPNAQTEFLRRYGIPILLAYGATEFGGVVSAMTPALYERFGPAKLTSVGRPWASTQVRVVDPNSGAPLPAGESGALEILTPRCGPDWIRTTDLASLDEEGFLYHRGRADGAIMRGGYKILPDDVAEKISLHASVAAAAVVGIPDARLGEIPVAAVELRPGRPPPSLEELRAHARLHLYSTHVPVHFRIVAELPRTSSMKIHLPGVRQLFDDLLANPGQGPDSTTGLRSTRTS